MANTGYAWSHTWSAMQKSSSDWTADALADSATETGDALSQNVKTATEVTIAAAEDNTGAISGEVSVYVLRDIDGTNYEETTTGNPQKFNFTPVQNDTVYIPFTVYGLDVSRFKVAVENNSGQELAITVKYQQSDVPPAS